MIATKHLPVEVLAELANEFAAGLSARAAVMREAIDEMELRRNADAATRLRLTAHTLAGTASAFGANELVPHAERLESLGRTWQDTIATATATSIDDARTSLERLTASIESVVARLQRRESHR
jgi:HPt (histidine-containing phosphotransfer) domain-containing protein